MDDLWDEITIHIQGKAYSLGNTDKEKRVIIQYVMTKKQLALLKAFKEKDLDINIRSQTIDVKINETLSEERIQKVLKTVLEIIGKFISKFDVKKEEVGRWVPLCRESNGDEIGMSGAQAPRIPNHRQAQVPVLASREGNHFFDPDPDNVCIFTVQEKRKTSSKKWLIPIAIGIGTAIAAPIVIPAAVGALGFGSGGIVGGSIAASMMSAAAVANGGGVAAGGLIATLQSIGATGAISAGTALLSGTATGAVSGVIVAATKQRRGQKLD